MVGELIAWLCRSPRRLIVTGAAVLFVVILGGSTLFNNTSGSGAAAPGGTGGPTSAPASTAAQVPDAAPYVGAAVTFVREWSTLKPGESASAWQARLAPLATPQLASALKTTDPANLPGVGPSTDEPVVRFVAQSSALIAVPLTDGSSVLVTVVTGGVDPLVSDIQPNVGD